jgi:nickel-dependent lactate racemase
MTATVDIRLNYGNDVQKISVPSDNLVCIAKARHLPTFVNEEAKIVEALDHTIGSPKLSDIVSPGKKIALIVDDATRSTPTNKILPIILERLSRTGVEKRDIIIVMATGAHREPSQEQIKNKVGEEVLSNVNVQIHDCLDKNRLKLIGFSSSGTPAWINEHVAEADIKIGIGMIKPHTWTGFGGGAKIVLPGVSAWEAIGRNHFLATSDEARIGNIEGNPVRRDMEEIAHKAGLSMIVNTVCDDGKKIVDVVAGDLVEAHRKGVEACRSLFENRIKEPVDILIYAFGPRDDNLWDVLTGNFIGAQKKLLKDGGTLIILASCPNGIYKYGDGHLDYTGKIADYSKVIKFLQKGLSPEEILSETIRGNMPYLEIGAKAYILAKIAKKNSVLIVSKGLKKEEVSWLGKIIDKPQEAIDNALQSQGKGATVAVMPEFGSSGAYIGIY